ncbi:Rrf2 family transcriptional regulator [Govanella unica]|uniref:Rrf2 family transcriptional regulator n=1 Tax=Govanella unica TaxID=2975056 RepID=A0A9X3TUU4_9PROT|nr:Rrf2 family transcriptional regulator [Govania unica]MDA5192546.1 Rrf2 family transcriptional regulator [Govania unica]
MQLTQFTDYALRVLIYLGVKQGDATIGEIVDSYGISKNHLTKVVHSLARLGFVQSTRGKGGGIRLAMRPEDISVAAVVAATEPNFNLVECFELGASHCPLVPSCLLKRALHEANQAFLTSLERHSLADLLGNRRELTVLLKVPAVP